MAVAAVAVLVAVTVGGLAVGSALVARHRAQAAADLAALAGAAALAVGPEAVCARAAATAVAMAGTVADCTIDGLDVVVTVEVDVPVGRWRPGPARAVARAGPVGSDSGFA